MRVFHARLHASSGKNTALKRCPSCPFVLNGLVLSLLTLKSPFWPVLWPFCPVLCPFWPSHKLLKFTGTICDTTFIDNFEGFEGIEGSKGIFWPCVFPWISCVAKQTTSHDSSQPMIYLQTIITFFLKCLEEKSFYLQSIEKKYLQRLYLTVACWLHQPKLCV